MKGWPLVVARGITVWPLKLAGFIVVPFIDKKNNPIWGNSWTSDYSYWNMTVRNGCNNYTRKPMPKYGTKANTSDWTLENEDGFQWRYRWSLPDAKYVSFRMSWGKVHPSKGKKEFYIGWKMRDPRFEDGLMRLTFFSIRAIRLKSR